MQIKVNKETDFSFFIRIIDVLQLESPLIKKGPLKVINGPRTCFMECRNYSLNEISTDGRMVAQTARAPWILCDLKALISSSSTGSSAS